MKNKKNGFKTVLTAIGVLLLIVILIGGCMQLFAKDEALKPSNWFDRGNYGKVAEWQVIDGLKFDTSATPDFSKLPMEDYIIYGNDSKGFAEFGLAVSSLDEEGKFCLLVSEESETYANWNVLYSEADIDKDGIVAKKGWNSEVLDKNGNYKFKYNYIVNSFDADSAENWNGNLISVSIVEETYSFDDLKKIEVGQSLDGLYFNPTELDLSIFAKFMNEYDDTCVLADFEDGYVLYVVRYPNSEGKKVAFSLIYTQRNDEFITNYVNDTIYATDYYRFNNGDEFRKGWHLDELNFFEIKNISKVTALYHEELWNGKMIGGSIFDPSTCPHYSLSEGICNRCGKVIELRLVEILSYNGMPDTIYVGDDEKILENLTFVFRTNAGTEVTVDRSNYHIESFETSTAGSYYLDIKFGDNDMYQFSLANTFIDYEVLERPNEEVM